MAFTTLISTAELADHLDDPNWVIVDCRFALSDTEKGRNAYLESHIPGAVYAHLDEDLSGPIIPGETGRHPLPDADQFAQKLSAWGVDAQTQVIAYDDMGGFMAGRLWWMLGWLGHEQTAVLDGDWRHWVKEGRPTRSGAEVPTLRTFIAQERTELVVNVDEVMANLENDEFVLVNARDEARYRGEGPTGLDPVNGHIPGRDFSLPWPQPGRRRQVSLAGRTASPLHRSAWRSGHGRRTRRCGLLLRFRRDRCPRSAGHAGGRPG